MSIQRSHVLDLTRLTSRLGRGPLTGIDRVELAYLAHFLDLGQPLLGLVRTSVGYILLDNRGCDQLLKMVSGRVPLPGLPFWARPFASPTARGAIAMQRFALARRPFRLLPGLLRKIPPASVYLNVGHSNLSAPMLQAIKAAQMQCAVMIHDTIPLDYPQFARHGSPEIFRAKIAATAQFADLALHISHDARAKTEGHFAKFGRVPRGVTAPLGASLAPPLPAPLTPSRPYFVALGTIEPRKNLQLLLNIWENIGTGPNDPQLVIIGAKGWADPAQFAQIDRLIAQTRVLHDENISDGAVVTLLSGSIALLFPSLAEGFGLPPVEALALGVPIVASNLPVLRETCKDFPVYLSPTDSYSWMETIRQLTLTNSQGVRQRDKQPLPSWADHFKAVLTQLG